MTLLRHLAVAVVVGVVIVILSVRLDAFRDYQIAEVACYVVAVAGLTVLVGLSGQISLGNGAFMAIGAYAAALMTLHLGWPLAAVLVAANRPDGRTIRTTVRAARPNSGTRSAPRYPPT